MSRPVVPAATVDYPSSDGKPMAETDVQRAAIMYGIGALENHYRHRPDVYVSGDLLVYYEEGNPKASVAPDVFVVFGVADRRRPIYKVWEEGKAPDFALEVASRGTWRDDVGAKRALYARLGVREYWQHDPEWEYLPSRLMGMRLVGGVYERLPVVESMERTLTAHSEVLGLELRVRGGELRFHDPETGRALLSHREEHIARRAAEARIAELEALVRSGSD